MRSANSGSNMTTWVSLQCYTPYQPCNVYGVSPFVWNSNLMFLTIRNLLPTGFKIFKEFQNLIKVIFFIVLIYLYSTYRKLKYFLKPVNKLCSHHHNRVRLVKQSNARISFSCKFTLFLVPIEFTFNVSVGCLGNFLVLTTIMRSAEMRSARNVFIGNLALSDLCLCVVTMPLTLVSVLAILQPPSDGGCHIKVCIYPWKHLFRYQTQYSQFESQFSSTFEILFFYE